PPHRTTRHRIISWRTNGPHIATTAHPNNPDAKPQTKNQPKESGKAHAKNAALATTIIARSAGVAPARAAVGRASKAPPRYPARFAAPRYSVDDGENQCAAISAGISGV